MNERRWLSAGWFIILVFPLAFLNFQAEAFAQYYKTMNKDGTISFSDNPTSSILQRNPARETTGPREEKEKPHPVDSGGITDEAASPTAATSDKPSLNVSRKEPAGKKTEAPEEAKKPNPPEASKASSKESTPSLPQKMTEGLNPDLMKLSLPGKNWAMEFNFRDFQVEDMSILPDYKGRRIMATNKKTNLILSVSFTPAPRKVSHKEFRDEAWERLERLPFRREGVKKYEVGQWFILEYNIKDVKEIKDVNQKNVFAYRVQDDTWIDFHLSKVLYTAADEGLFKQFIASARVLDSFIPSSIDHFGYGSYFYSNKDYEKAIVYYEKALEQEKQTPRLQKKFWVVLVDNLGMAYGLSGNLKMAEKTFQYGIAKDPSYPLFYYNLACAYAEANDLDRALVNLAKAGEYTANMIPGEKWPEVATDPSFKRFRENKRFIEAANKFLQ